MGESNFTWKAIGIGLITLLLALIMIVFGYFAVNKVIHVEDLWNEYNQQATAASSALHNIHVQFGYGGFIHNFKNYVLRRDSSLLPIIDENLKSSLDAINRYNKLNLNNAEKESLGRLRMVLENYAAVVEVAQISIAKGIPSTEVDRLVRVDDTPALEAIAFLASSGVIRSSHKEEQTGTALAETINFLLLGGLIIPVIFAAGLIFMLLLRQVLDANRKALNAQNELRQAQKLEAISHLAGGIAHEFNNLLQVIMGFNSIMMEDTPESDPRRSYLMSIKEASERGATLVNQMLGFSRQTGISPTVMDMNSLILTLEPLFQAAIGQQITLNIELERNLHLTFADKGVIEQILLNLIINSRHAMEDKGVLTLQTRNSVSSPELTENKSENRKGEYIRIIVTDTGSGMADSVLEHIFDPFFTTKGPQEGTGLGLSMVYGLVEQHNGWINVSSQVGVGTTFEICMPIVERVLDENVKSEGEVASPLPLTKSTILVAEDERGVQALTSIVLEKAGYIVLSAYDGVEAIKIYNENQKDIKLVLLDVVMPKLNGVEVYHKIREQNHDIPVIFQTGRKISSEYSEFFSDKSISLLNKPYTPDELRKTLRATLQADDVG